jgi:hypothetical protein
VFDERSSVANAEKRKEGLRCLQICGAPSAHVTNTGAIWAWPPVCSACRMHFQALQPDLAYNLSVHMPAIYRSSSTATLWETLCSNSIRPTGWLDTPPTPPETQPGKHHPKVSGTTIDFTLNRLQAESCHFLMRVLELLGKLDQGFYQSKKKEQGLS